MNDLISRQAAIDELVKMLSDCFYADEEVLDAVETTLKELPSAEPEIMLESASDLIDRQTVIDMVKGWNLNQHIMNEEDALDDVKELPSAESRRKNGKWNQIISIPNDIYGRYYCSECGKEGNPFWYFCPNCGSYNGGEEE